MANITMMISIIFLCLTLLSFTHGESDWRASLRKRIARASFNDDPSVSSFTTFQNEALIQTNKYRAAHCAPNVVLSSKLNAIAQAYADKLASIQTLVHSNNGYGENLYFTSSSQGLSINSVKGSKPIDNWYTEVTQYNWGSPDFSSSTGHFTQLVWISTQQFGIGIACTADQQSCYIVANYSPPGNFIGQFDTNVKQGSCA